MIPSFRCFEGEKGGIMSRNQFIINIYLVRPPRGGWIPGCMYSRSQRYEGSMAMETARWDAAKECGDRTAEHEGKTPETEQATRT
jgi:hypothetical protein